MKQEQTSQGGWHSLSSPTLAGFYSLSLSILFGLPTVLRTLTGRDNAPEIVPSLAGSTTGANPPPAALPRSLYPWLCHPSPFLSTGPPLIALNSLV